LQKFFEELKVELSRIAQTKLFIASRRVARNPSWVVYYGDLGAEPPAAESEWGLRAKPPEVRGLGAPPPVFGNFYDFSTKITLNFCFKHALTIAKKG